MQIKFAHNICSNSLARDLGPLHIRKPWLRSYRRIAALLCSAAPLTGPAIALILGQIAGLCGGLTLLCSIAVVLAWQLLAGLEKRVLLCLLVGLGQGSLVMKTSALKEPPTSLSGTVISEPQYPKGELITFKLRASAQNLAGKIFECRGPILPWLESSKVGLGSGVAMSGKLRLYSAEAWSYDWYRRISGAAGECKFKQLAQAPAELTWIAHKRQVLKKTVREAIGDNERAGLLLSTAFGFRDQLSLSTEEIFRRAGLSHVLVASGYQVGMIFIVAFAILRKITVRHVVLAHSRVLGLLKWLLPGMVAILYTALIGAESSTIRATIAVILQLLATSHHSPTTPLGTLVASIFILSLASPGTLLTPGTQLTYGALLGIMLGSSLSSSRTAGAILVAVAAGSITGALSVIWFKQYSLISPLTNIILAPIISVVAVNGSLIALACKVIIPAFGNFLLRALADCLVGLLEMTDYIVPSWAFIEIESDSKLKLAGVAAIVGLPATILMLFWTRRTLALFDGVTLRRRTKQNSQ